METSTPVESLEKLKICVTKVLFTNPTQSFTVMYGETQDEAESRIKAVGYMPDVSVGNKFDLYGQWETSKYGQQFHFYMYEMSMPDTLEAIYAYLTSNSIKGIGKVYAKRLIAKFGLDTLDVIENHPDRLSEVSGMGKTRIEKLTSSYSTSHAVRRITMELGKYGLTGDQIAKIQNTYKEESVHKVKSNPYALADDISGFGFITVDTIAQKIGFAHDHPLRIRSGILHTLKDSAKQFGHCFLTSSYLIKECASLLEVDSTVVSAKLSDMARTDDVIIQDLTDGGSAVYLPKYYQCEEGVAKRLACISGAAPSQKLSILDIGSIVKSSAMQYDAAQLDCIYKTATTKVLILTGGPGTGKTTTTKGMVDVFRELGLTVLLAAPTGRAAKRLSEATDAEAMTIHRLLEYSMNQDGLWVFKRNPKNPLEGDVLIVDECSMVDIQLMYSLLRAVPDSMRVIFVGDIDQLPSVGAGNVLRDLISSDCYTVVQLTKVFRQAQRSMIIRNAHKVNKGMQMELEPAAGTDSLHDFTFIDIEDKLAAEGVKTPTPEQVSLWTALEVVYQVRNGGFHHYNHYDMVKDVQILAPMKKGHAGTNELNVALQESLNSTGKSLNPGSHIFRVRDKVMQIKNNYDKDVFNGNIGYIKSINDEDKKLVVAFDGKNVEYDFNELDELLLAYAVTVHKSQGSEYPVVILPLINSHYVMLQRNLLYTAITRAKKHLVIIGTKKALEIAIRNNKVANRNSFLLYRCQFFDSCINSDLFSD